MEPDKRKHKCIQCLLTLSTHYTLLNTSILLLTQTKKVFTLLHVQLVGFPNCLCYTYNEETTVDNA